MNTKTRRQITEAEFVKGARVYKGNGKTLYRIASVTDNYYGYGHYAMVVKATTVTDPKSGCWYPISLYTVDA